MGKDRERRENTVRQGQKQNVGDIQVEKIVSVGIAVGQKNEGGCLICFPFSL